MPTEVVVDRNLLIVLDCWMNSAAPDEGCALLLGVKDPVESELRLQSRRNTSQPWTLRLLWPCQNVWSNRSQRRRRFAIDPREQLVAQRWGRARGLQVLGTAHSHPTTSPVPSITDCRLCVTPALMVIQGAGGEQRAWWLAEQSTQPQPLPWRMEL
jgi:proteasome lid subunit RPN8/RPN11